MKAIINGKIIFKNNILVNKVLVFDDKIIDICDTAPTDCELIDAKGLYVSPGLIDIHIHGSCGSDTMDEDPGSIDIISEGIAKNGVTSFLPTTMTMSKERIYNSLNNIKNKMNKVNLGSEVLGAHLEGPFINNSYKGAQSDKYTLRPSMDFIKDYLDIIKVISYAPELDDEFKFTKEITKNTDIVLSVAHSNATYDEVVEAVNNGVKNITHLFNAMSPLNHREMGVVGGALMTDTFTEIICDNIHVNPKMYQFVLNNKGKNRIVLITDCMRAGCMGNGTYDLGGQKVLVKDGAARLEAGNLAGSVLTLNKAVLNFLKNTTLSISESIDLASLNPAKSLGIDNKKGSLEISKDADIALFDDDMNCHLTICSGKIVFNALENK